METITPTYEEGITRGAAEEARKGTLEKLIATFDRDKNHALTMRDQGLGIVRALSRVASCTHQEMARLSAEALIDALEALEEHYSSTTDQYRTELRDLVNGEGR